MPVEKLTKKTQFSFSERHEDFPFSLVKFLVSNHIVQTKLKKRKSPHHQPLSYRYTVSISFSIFNLMTGFLFTGVI